MGNYEQLKNAIAEVIKTNGNQEITGQILQNVLKSIVNTLGANATFAGVATPTTNPGTPEQKVFYIAGENGIYINFNGIEVNNKIAVIYNTNNQWVKNDLPIVSQNFIENYVDEAISRINPTVINIQGDVTNAADEEDLTSANRLLKLKDRVSSTNQAGYCIIRRDVPFIEQVSGKENTIFEIRYGINLAGAIIDMPNNSILKFNGGKITNGTLRGNFNVTAYGLNKIFSQVHFEGACTNGIFEIDWWIANKNNSCKLDGTQLDATQEMQDAFSSGVANIHFSNKYYYYISSPISINSWTAISGNKVNNCGQRNPAEANPCVYTDLNIVMFNVLINSDNDRRMVHSLNISNVYLRRYADFDIETYNVDTPSIKISNSAITSTMTFNSLWGCYIDVYLYSADRQKTLNLEGTPKTIFTYGYKGIEIVADKGGYITYIVIKGEINGFRKALSVKAVKITGSWVTDCRIYCDTFGVYGGDIEASPARIYGSHQPRSVLTSYDSIYYFNTYDCISHAMIWDLGAVSQGFVDVKKPFYANGRIIDFVNQVASDVSNDKPLPPGEFYGKRSAEFIRRLTGLSGVNVLENIFVGAKGLLYTDNAEDLMSNATLQREIGSITKCVVKDDNNNELAISADNTIGYSNLFRLSGSSETNIPGLSSAQTTYDTAMLLPTVVPYTYKKYIVEVELPIKLYNALLTEKASIGIKAGRPRVENGSIIIKSYNNDNVELSTFTYAIESEIFYETHTFYRELPPVNEGATKVSIQFTYPIATSQYRVIPTCFIVSYRSTTGITPSGGEIPFRLVLGDVMTANYTSDSELFPRYIANKFINKRIAISTNNWTNIIAIKSIYAYPYSLSFYTSHGKEITLKIGKGAAGEAYSKSNASNVTFRVLSSSDKTLSIIQAKSTIANDKLYLYEVKGMGKLRFLDASSVDISTLTIEEIVSAKRGLTSQRPTNPIEGDEYYDSNLKKKILWNGSIWVNIDGSNL